MGRPIQKKALIQTERLTLKPFSLSDKDRLANLLTDQQITKTFMVTDFETAAQACALAEKLIRFSQIDDTRHLEYGIYVHGRLIGGYYSALRTKRRARAGHPRPSGSP